MASLEFRTSNYLGYPNPFEAADAAAAAAGGLVYVDTVCTSRGGNFGGGMSGLVCNGSGGQRYVTYSAGTPGAAGEMIVFGSGSDVYMIRGVDTVNLKIYVYPFLSGPVMGALAAYAPSASFTVK